MKFICGGCLWGFVCLWVDVLFSWLVFGGLFFCLCLLLGFFVCFSFVFVVCIFGVGFFFGG